MKITDCDVIFLSFDEPNAEENWENLKKKYPLAKRVHGVVGIDSAHKVCANKANTDWFVTIDGDNIVFSEFFEVEIAEHLLQDERSIVFPSKNIVNNLVYANGAIKCWHKKFLLNNLTTENAPHKRNMDFGGYMTRYDLPRKCFAETRINGSSYQAWRAGIREGMKLTFNRINDTRRAKTFDKLRLANKERLSIWCNVGLDVVNGIWCMYGARLGIFLSFLSDFEPRTVNYFNKLHQYWMDHCEFKNPYEEADKLGKALYKQFGFELIGTN